jgi:hypothetical protein
LYTVEKNLGVVRYLEKRTKRTSLFIVVCSVAL